MNVTGLDPLVLGRVLFAATAGLHFLFVATTLGLSPLIAVMSTRAAVRRNDSHDRALRVLGNVYAVNYAVGIVTGLVMELQMALVWSGPGSAVYDPIVTLLALETVVAFFLESTLLGVWLAGAGILGRGVRAAVFWGVTVTAYASAALVIGTNSFLHQPIDLGLGLGLAQLAEVVLRPASLTVLTHVAAASLVVGGFWAAAAGTRIAARSGDVDAARHLVRLGVGTVAWAAPLSVVTGVAQFPTVRAAGVATAQIGWFGVALAAMMLVGVAITALTWMVMVPLTWTGMLLRPGPARALVRYGVAIPLATTFAGWLYREEARQPWFVVGRVTTAEAMTPLSSGLLSVMCVAFVGIRLAAAVTAWRVMYAVMDAAPSSVATDDDAADRDLEPGWIG